MILKRLKLVNYGGIYNGIGRNEIEIDFTRCKNRIILIKGDNGSGKSTIENALKPLPDDNSSFIQGKDARKEIEYIDVDGTIFSIVFIHEVSGSTRKSKGYISKTINGITKELNPSGNITSCKDIIYEELQLDPNYITLTQLSSNKRGIADLKPADRKRYVNAILSSTDVYNDMYKKLTKKASMYKSLMQNITAKLDSIGNVAQLEQSLKLLISKIEEAEANIERYNEIINKEKGMLNSIDPDNTIRERIDYLESKKHEFTEQYNAASKTSNKICIRYPAMTVGMTQETLDKMNNDIINLRTEITILENKVQNMLESRQVDSQELQAKISKLNSINSGTSISELVSMKHELQTRKKQIIDRWGDIVYLDSLGAEDFVIAYEAIKNMVDVIKMITRIIPENMIGIEYYNATERIKKIEDEIENVINDNNRIMAAEDKLAILDNRPADCTNDKCPFIADALKAREIIKSIRKHASLSELNNAKKECAEAIENIDENKKLIQMYNVNKRLFMKLKLGLNSYEETINIISVRFNEILSMLSGLICYADDLDEFSKLNTAITDIENRYHSLSAQEDFINMITDDIDRLQKQLDSDTLTIDSTTRTINDKKIALSNLEQMMQISVELFEANNIMMNCSESLRIIDEEIDTNRSNIDKIQKINEDITLLSGKIVEIKSKLAPMKKDRDTIDYKLKVSVDYAKEFNQYKTMYDKIDTLKYYCSPTTGIQLLFANMYLSKIMDSANNILCRLFNGTFALLPLIITESEFRIPVAVNGGINHDDITSMSSAQISLISMIISIALLSQTSTKLNIIVGDEIDAPFDSENRREFINILYQLMGLVNASQCVLISHNSEISTSDCDVILLKSSDPFNEGNIIWSYK
jgi:DNA repair exonuclease SbcCD ATPase subunit